MLEAEVTKLVVMPEKGKTVLMGVAEYYGDCVNFRVPYDWDTLDIKGFLNDLREKLAEDFDLPTYRIALPEQQIVERMRDWHIKFKTLQ
jgi:hypothetical protein